MNRKRLFYVTYTMDGKEDCYLSDSLLCASIFWELNGGKLGVVYY